MSTSLMEYVELLASNDLLVASAHAIGVTINFFWSPVLPFCLAVYFGFTHLVAWKLKNCSVTSNSIVFFGQVLLASSLLFCFQSIYHFHDSSFIKSFMFCCISCCLNSFSMLISYDFRSPPNQKLGLLLSAVGTIVNLFSAFHIYNSQWSHIAHVPYILGLHIFVIGLTILCMHMLNAVYEVSLMAVKKKR